MMGEICKYLDVQLMRLNHNDWDEVESVLKKVLKNPAANPNYKPERAQMDAMM